MKCVRITAVLDVLDRDADDESKTGLTGPAHDALLDSLIDLGLRDVRIERDTERVSRR